MNLLDLPDCMLEQIFEYLSYDEIAKKRIVSVKINKVCQQLLNRGFHKMIKRHTFNLKKIKSHLPRRESERRNHPLAKHADILTCIETRISMLSMTYSKYIDSGLCCFIPGKIIDEVYNVLKLVDGTTKPLRSHEVLQELRDISSMAIDHFDEKIAYMLKKSFCDLSTQKYGSNLYQIMQSPIESYLQGAITADIVEVTSKLPAHSMEEYTPCLEAQTNRLAIESAVKKLNKIILTQAKQAREIRQIKNSSIVLSELNSQISDLRRRLEESEAKNREFAANINQIKTFETAGGSSSTSAATAASTSSSSSLDKLKPRNIKPRAATIILKRRIAEDVVASTSCRKRAKK